MPTRPKVDREIETLLPPPSAEELAQLEKSLREEGCRDPLVVWDEADILLDGHNRLAICEKYDLRYDTVRLNFSSREAAIQWVIDNQLGRRNLTDERRRYYRGKEYHNRKQAHGGQIPGGSAHFEHSLDSRGKTAAQIAVKHGVSPATVRRDEEFAIAVDKIAEEKGPEAKEAILSGRSGLSKAEVVQSVRPAPPQRTRAPAEPAARPPAPTFDVPKFESEVGALERAINRLGSTFGVMFAPRAEELRTQLRKFKADLLQFHKELSARAQASRG